MMTQTNNVKPGGKTSDIEQQILMEMHNFAKLGDVRRVNYALQGILTTLIPYLEKERDFDRFSDEIDNIMKPNITYSPQAIGGQIGSYTLEDKETKLVVPVEKGNKSLAMNVFREYQYQNMNKRLLKLLRQVWRVLQKEGKLSWDAVRNPSPYIKMALSESASDDSSESPASYTNNFFEDDGDKND